MAPSGRLLWLQSEGNSLRQSSRMSGIVKLAVQLLNLFFGFECYPGNYLVHSGYDYNLFLKSFCHFFGLHLKLVFKLLKLLPFFRGTEMLHLAVLHSRRLCVYSVSGKKHFLFLM